ncbi:alpha/beta hydrolase [Rickettsiales bacterium LUAb2]
MELNYKVIEAQNKLDNIVILLHGYGSSAEDLSELAKIFTELPNTTFIIPNAPNAIAEYNGYYWFPLIFTETDIKIANEEDIQKANIILQSFIEQIKQKYNVSAEKIAIFGFSQGGIMALYNGVNNITKYGAIISHSGLLFLEKVNNNLNKQQNILLIHGEQDNVVSVDKFYQTLEFFKKNNIPYKQLLKDDLGHSIDEETIEATESFLLANLY